MSATHVPSAASARELVHHPDEALLFDYATGALGRAESLLVAAHITLCPQCRAQVKRFEAIGGALMETQASTVGGFSVPSISAYLTDAGEAEVTSEVSGTVGDDARLPRVLQQAFADGTIRWRSPMPGVKEAVLPLPRGHGEAKLLRIAPGAAVPQHTHHGTELTLVLSGSFDDETGHYGVGDVQMADDDVHHRPVAGPDAECLCFAVTEAPLRLTGPISGPVSRFLDLFSKR